MDLAKFPQAQTLFAEGQNFDLRLFIRVNVTVPEILALTELLWPEFVEHRGCVFLKFVFDEAGVNRWFENLEGNNSAIEAVVNHVHLWDFFSATTEEERAGLSHLADVVQAMWQTLIGQRFPGREFAVSVSDETNDYVPTLTLCSA